MTIEEAQKIVDHWIKTVGVRYFNELTNMAILTEEVGEMARIIARKNMVSNLSKHQTKNMTSLTKWLMFCGF